jgi:hypothetical protein
MKSTIKSLYFCGDLLGIPNMCVEIYGKKIVRFILRQFGRDLGC